MSEEERLRRGIENLMREMDRWRNEGMIHTYGGIQRYCHELLYPAEQVICNCGFCRACMTGEHGGAA